jgi:hypothetical protein
VKVAKVFPHPLRRLTSEDALSTIVQLPGQFRVRSLNRVPILIVPVAVLAIYLPVVVVPYLFMDDYTLFAWQHGFGGSIWQTAAQGGRPMEGLLLLGSFSAVHDINGLRLVRFVALVGAALLGLLFFYALRRSGFNRWLSMGASVSVVSLPSVQVYVSWTVLAFAPYAAILAGLAALLAGSALGHGPRTAFGRRAEATGLLLCALLIYQPAAMFFWVFTAVRLLRPSESLSRAAKDLAESLGVGITAMAVSLGVIKVATHYYGPLGSGRSSFTNDFFGKFRWFLDQPLVNSLNLFNLTPTRAQAVGVAIVASVGILLLHAHKGWKALGFLLIAAILVPLSYLPNLAVKEDWASYRSIGGLSALLAVYTWFGLWGIGRAALTLHVQSGAKLVAARIVAVGLAALMSFLWLTVILSPLWHFPNVAAPYHVSTAAWPSARWLAGFAVCFAVFAGLGLWATRRSYWRFRPKPSARFVAIGIGNLAAITLAFTGALLAARNVTTLFVKPQSIELEMLRSALDKSNGSPLRRVVLIRPNWSQGAAPLVRYDEFGLPSTYQVWVPDPAVFLILREEGRQTERPVEEDLPWTARALPGDVPRGEVFVDMRNLQDRRVDWSFWTVHAATG